MIHFHICLGLDCDKSLFAGDLFLGVAEVGADERARCALELNLACDRQFIDALYPLVKEDLENDALEIQREKRGECE